MPRASTKQRIPAARIDDVARDLMTTVLACEEALDAFVLFSGHALGNGPTHTRLMAARQHIRHARSIAIAAGLFLPGRIAGTAHARSTT